MVYPLYLLPVSLLTFVKSETPRTIENPDPPIPRRTRLAGSTQPPPKHTTEAYNPLCTPLQQAGQQQLLLFFVCSRAPAVSGFCAW